MKKYLLLLTVFWVLSACDKKEKIESAIQEIPVNMKVSRFEQAFFEATPQTLSKVKTDYPDFFPKEVPDQIWIEKLEHPQWRQLYAEVEKKYRNFDSQKEEIEGLFKHIKYYFPTVQVPHIYTAIGDMDYLNKTIYAHDKLIIALELYLGKEHRFYDEFPAYLKQNFEPRQMLPDVVSSFAFGILTPSRDKELLPLMVNAGKELYLKDILIPEYTDAEKIGYTPEQIKWSQENESFIWTYFIQKKLLYSSDSKLPNRFINLAPFSKFYLEIDNESPGRIGQWIGWQIVRSFMENNEVSIQQMLKMDPKEIFEKSKYKPKKYE